MMLEAMKIVELLVNSGLSEDVLRSFRARARGLASELAVNGLASTLVLLAARSSAVAIERMGLRSSGFKDAVEAVKNRAEREKLNIEGGEAAGYALYAAALLHLLKHDGMSLPATLKDLVERALKDPILEHKALEAASWLKRAAEAYIPGR